MFLPLAIDAFATIPKPTYERLARRAGIGGRRVAEVASPTNFS
jgi:hypothetical protein